MIAIKFVLLIAIFIIPSANQILAQSVLSKDQIKTLDRLATQDVPSGAPGLATAIISRGKVLYKKYAGYANLTDSLLIDSTTRFNIASNGKQFTALAILTLAQAKKLSLSDDIRKYLPGLLPAIKEKITIGNLLNHTSGIRDCYDLWSLQGYTWWKNTFSNNDVLTLLEKQASLNFAPGTQYLYSNSNYILLALIIQKASGQSFVAYTNYLFKLLQMPNTSFEGDFSQIRGSIAKAYFNFSSWTTYDWKWNVCGDGNLFTTLDDMIQWEKIVQGSVKTVISSKLIAAAQQPIPKARFKKYGFGLEFGHYKGMPITFHEGATGAWKSTIIRFTNQYLSLITMTNTGKAIPAGQTREMADFLLGLPEQQVFLKTKPDKTGPYLSETEVAGVYLTPDDFIFTLESHNQQLLLKRQGRNDVIFEREGPNIFHQKTDSLFKLEFTTNKMGERQVTAYYINHAPYTLTRKNPDFTNFDFGCLNGEYNNYETNTVISLKHLTAENYQVVFAANADTLGAVLVQPDKLLTNQYSLIIQRGATGPVSLFLNGDRIKQVEFVKQ